MRDVTEVSRPPLDLSRLIPRIKPLHVRGTPRRIVSGVKYDSRQTGPGNLFVARRGSQDDGHRFIADALRRGAIAVVHERELPNYDPSVCYLQVNNAPSTLAAASAWFTGDPANHLLLIGVTGTDGKSSTAWFTKILLDQLGVPAGLVSSVYVDDGTGVKDSPWRLSTPEAPELHGLLATMVDHSLSAAVIETTSIALALGRVEGLPLTAAAITNITHEHLEFHGNWKRYRDAKAGLLDMLQDRLPNGLPGSAVINRDDAAWEHLSNRFPTAQSFTTNPTSHRDGTVPDCTTEVYYASGSDLTLTVDLHGVRRRRRVQLRDPVQAGNVAAACLLAASVTEASPDRVLDALSFLTPLPGRMEPIKNDRDLTILIDHAHTPAAFEHLFAGLNILPDRNSNTEGRVIIVFGSAGEKDRQKRALQGRIASEHSDLVILTDEDPRGEDPMLILNEIAAGFVSKSPEPMFIPDRRKAIDTALKRAKPGDTLLFLGKGHERTIEYSDHIQPWDEGTEIRSALNTPDSLS